MIFPENGGDEGLDMLQAACRCRGHAWIRHAAHTYHTHGSVWPTFAIGRTARVDQERMALGGRSRPAAMKSPSSTPGAAKQDSDIEWLAAGAWVDGGALAPMQQAAQALHDAWWVVAESSASWDGQCADAASCSIETGAACPLLAAAAALPQEGDMTTAIP
jgi:hypothetical protein